MWSDDLTAADIAQVRVETDSVPPERQTVVSESPSDGVSITLFDGRTENLTGEASATDSDPPESLCITPFGLYPAGRVRRDAARQAWGNPSCYSGEACGIK